MERLAGRVAIVTGAGSGIGRAVAVALAGEGVATLLIGRTAQRLEATADMIAAMGGDSLVVAIDVADGDAFDRVRDAALARFGRVDIVVNNAGALSTGLPEDIPIAEWHRVFEINLMAVVRSNAVFLPLLLAQGEGHLVNTASVDGLYGFGYDRLPYASSKAALVQLSEGLVHYLRPRGIGVTCLCPGPVDSEIGSLMRHFGRAHDIHGPGATMSAISSRDVGAMVVDAIRRDIFLLLTHPAEVGPLIRHRARDMDGFIDAQIAAPEIVARYAGDREPPSA